MYVHLLYLYVAVCICFLLWRKVKSRKPSEIASECTFSKNKIIMTDKKTSMGDDTRESILRLKQELNNTNIDRFEKELKEGHEILKKRDNNDNKHRNKNTFNNQNKSNNENNNNRNNNNNSNDNDIEMSDKNH